MAEFPQHRPLSYLRSITSGLVDLAFPPRCACCSAWGRAPLCNDCATDIAHDRLAEACPVCAGSVGPFEASSDGCGACRQERRRILGTARVGTYGGLSGEMVRQYKFKGRHDVEPILVEWLADSILAARWADRVEAVTFVPTHWRRTFKSRVHVARSLARGAARRLDLPCIPLLRRTRWGPRQVGLSYPQRLENVRGAFSLIRGTFVRGARILIIDDVRTTGATLEECAKALRKGRAAEVYAAVVARAKGADDDPSPQDRLLPPWRVGVVCQAALRPKLAAAIEELRAQGLAGYQEDIAKANMVVGDAESSEVLGEFGWRGVVMTFVDGGGHLFPEWELQRRLMWAIWDFKLHEGWLRWPTD